MSTSQASRSIELQPGATAHFTVRGRQRLSFRSGSRGLVWLTRDGDIRDYMLGNGDAISLCAGDQVWLTLQRASDPVSMLMEPLSVPQPLWRKLGALLSLHAAQTPSETPQSCGR